MAHYLVDPEELLPKDHQFQNKNPGLRVLQLLLLCSREKGLRSNLTNAV